MKRTAAIAVSSALRPVAERLERIGQRGHERVRLRRAGRLERGAQSLLAEAVGGANRVEHAVGVEHERVAGMQHHLGVVPGAVVEAPAIGPTRRAPHAAVAHEQRPRVPAVASVTVARSRRPRHGGAERSCKATTAAGPAASR